MVRSKILPVWSFPAVPGPRSVGGWSALGLYTVLFQPEVAYSPQTLHAWGSWSCAEKGVLDFTYFLFLLMFKLVGACVYCICVHEHVLESHIKL